MLDGLYYFTIVMGLLPVAWLSFLEGRRQRRDVAWWWLAGGFAISTAANLTGYFLPNVQRWVVSAVYPVSQSAIFGAVLLDRTAALMFLAILTPIGIVAATMGAAEGPDVLLRSVAWLLLVAVAWFRRDIPHRLRVCLIVYFLGSYTTWLVLAAWMKANPHAHGIALQWIIYQGAQLAGLLAFCWAASENPPRLRLVR